MCVFMFDKWQYGLRDETIPVYGRPHCLDEHGGQFENGIESEDDDANN